MFVNYRNIQIRDVYYFVSHILVGDTKEPHYHVVLATGQFLREGDPGVVVMVLYSYKPERLYELLKYRKKKASFSWRRMSTNT